MNLNVYDKQLNRIAIIGDGYVSCLWVEGYNTVENFTVELRKTSDYMRKVRPGVYVGRNDRKSLMIVESVEISDTAIIASGKTATRVLDNVAFVGALAADADFPIAIKEAYDNTDKVENVEFPVPDITASYGEEVRNKSILELCTLTCQNADVGFRAVSGNGVVNIEFYKPSVNPVAIYAEKYGNLIVNSLTFSDSKYKNYCVVIGTDVNETQVRVDIDRRINGEEKREIIVESNERWEKDVDTDETFAAKLRAVGVEKLSEYQKTFECAFSPYAQDFGTKFDLGDVITILLPDYDLRLQARVKRITQKSQKNSTKTTIEVGQITTINKR